MIFKSNVFDGRVVYDHLLKTGGQAVNAWLQDTLGSGTVTDNLIGDHRDLLRKYGGCYPVISGHLQFYGEGLDPRYKYVTCLRNPVERNLSWFSFLLNHSDSNELRKKAEKFISSCGSENDGLVFNYYVEHFSSVIDPFCKSEEKKVENAIEVLAAFDVCGIYEDFPLFLNSFAKLVGVRATGQIPQKNVTNYVTAPKITDDKLLACLFELNSMDMHLYEYIKQSIETKDRTSDNGIEYFSVKEPYNRSPYREFIDPKVKLIDYGHDVSGPIAKGKIINFRVDLLFCKPISDLEIGMHVFDSNMTWVFGVNSTLLSQKIKNQEAGFHRYNFSFVADLPDGNYTIGFAAADKSLSYPLELAWFDRLLAFDVSTPKRFPGVGYADLSSIFSSCLASNFTMQDGTIKIRGCDPALKSESGHILGRFLASTGSAGFLVYGPYLSLPSGRYHIAYHGRSNVGPDAFADIVSNAGSCVHHKVAIVNDVDDGLVAEFLVELERNVTDLETRVFVGEGDNLLIEYVLIKPLIDPLVEL